MMTKFPLCNDSLLIIFMGGALVTIFGIAIIGINTKAQHQVNNLVYVLEILTIMPILCWRVYESCREVEEMHKKVLLVQAAKIQEQPKEDDSNSDYTSHSQEITMKQQQQQSPFLLLICASGICGCYLYYGIIQERVFSKHGGGAASKALKQVGSITTFMLVLSCITNVFVVTVWIHVEKRFQNKHDVNCSSKQEVQVSPLKKKKKPLNHLLLLTAAFVNFAAMTASNESLGFVSYPTAVLAKSSKLIPIMIVGLLLERKSFSNAEWISAALITGGIIMFNLSRMESSSSSSSSRSGNDDDSSYGFFLLIFSLVMDGVLGSCQNFIKKESINSPYRSPVALESMLWSNAYACIFLLPLSISSGQFANGMKMLQHAHVSDDVHGAEAEGGEFSIAWSIALMNVTAAAGQVFIFFTIQLFSPLILTTITTTRMFFTILLSAWKFGHHFTSTQWISITMVFAGLYLAIVSKFATSIDTTVHSKHSAKDNSKKNKKMD